MTLSQPTAVAFAVSGGAPVDAREWVTIDLGGQPSSHRRGYVVFTESLTPTGRSGEIARQTQALIIQELRREQYQPADAALARAFAIANTVIFEEGRFRGGVGQQFLIGATAIIFEGHRATVAHVPPGQFYLAQDGLFYAIPELAAWLPHYAGPEDDAPVSEPLGYASWTSPILVETELREGDTLILCNAAIGRALSESSGDGYMPGLSPARFHGSDPDKVMDALREMALDREEPVAAVAVIGFPPPERGSGIETVCDIGRNAREQWRHTRASMRRFMPKRGDSNGVGELPTSTQPGTTSAPPGENGAPKITTSGQRRSEESIQDRLIRLTERRASTWRETWRQPSDMRQLGAPTAHGISRYRETSLDAGEPNWKTTLPRLPFIRSPIFIGFCILLLVGLLATGYMQRDRFLPSEDDYIGHIAEVDRRLILVRDMTDDDAMSDELDQASRDLEEAESAGAPVDLVRPRAKQISQDRDEIGNVIRLDDVTRVGSLPEELQDSQTSAIHTPGGLFLANESLYRLRSESREMVIVLQTGSEVEGMTVGDVFGVAYDGQALLTSDGEHVFFADSADGAAWQAMSLAEINQQGPWPAGPIGAFTQNMYLLVDDYRNIYQFELDPSKETTEPIDWVLTGDRINFDLAIDMTIDRSIYVLLQDGRVLTMYQGSQIAAFDVPTFDPETETPLAIIGGPRTGYLYVAVVDDDGHGRIIAMDREGGHMSQLALPKGLSTGADDVLPPFDELQDIGVDEDAGILYLINGDAVWTARYSLPPLPPLPQPEGTPAASPEAAE